MPTADELLGPAAADGLVAVIARAAPGKPLHHLRRAAAGLAGLSLRERCDLLAGAVLDDLPGDFASLAAVVGSALPDEELTGWPVWPVTEAVAARALAESPPAIVAALHLLAELTSRLTAEFAIRPLLSADPDTALAVVRTWTGHPDEHVRRLASEGTRPHLPWARAVRALRDSPHRTLPVLDALYRDESDYVRRSVANHLNDLSRADPDLVVATATRWLAAPDANTRRVVRHGLRTLVKKGHLGALALLGFGSATGVSVRGPLLDRTSVALGEDLSFQVVLSNTGESTANLAVDYVVHHLKANGTRTPKVFKLTTRAIDPGESLTLSRKHSFRRITTRTYHPGEHEIEVQVNGIASGRVAFHLSTADEH
ncbi:3-methyladenine DNA glycosylase AlkC [Lentzea xinjiangensis]|uniref:3-methyladenine DNA glycosylase AlkC n=1 Tax=Lentzea xinjiangensis TaxID=402600 RepID=A0A1H9SUY0_9PSEU|nr:DNA alkylation repair protein [Lentzea xinjiangensis]SER88746.1 3-methyladenine DNA glycosylase AlkC [Lentzea xinjiangensis]